MPLYEFQKILFVHIPKTAGTSIEYELRSRENALFTKTLPIFFGYPSEDYPKSFPRHPSMQHYSFSTLESLLGKKLDEYKIFTVVRNPFSRAVSEFYFNHLVRRVSPPNSINELRKSFLEFYQNVKAGKLGFDNGPNINSYLIMIIALIHALKF